MTVRWLSLLLLPLVGCAWEGRPDGAEAVHTASEGYYEPGVEPIGTPLGGGPVDIEIVEPLDPNAPLPGAAPVPQTQPAPTTGTDDTTSEVEEALTPGTEQ